VVNFFIKKVVFLLNILEKFGIIQTAIENLECKIEQLEIRSQQPITINHLQLTNLPIMSIENPTLVHFRHFRHFSSLLTNLPFTTVESALQISPFMQNEPNFRKSQMNVKHFNTVDYENRTLGENGKNEPKTNPIYPCVASGEAGTNPIYPCVASGEAGSNPISKAKKCCVFRLGSPFGGGCRP